MTTPPTFASAVKYRWFSLMYTIFPCTVPFVLSDETIPFAPSQLVGTPAIRFSDKHAHFSFSGRISGLNTVCTPCICGVSHTHHMTSMSGLAPFLPFRSLKRKSGRHVSGST